MRRLSPLLHALILALALSAPARARPPQPPEPTPAERAQSAEVEKTWGNISFLQQRLASQKARLAALDEEARRLDRERKSMEEVIEALGRRITGMLPGLWQMDVRLKGILDATVAPWDEADRGLSWMGAVYAQARREMAEFKDRNVELAATLTRIARLAPETQALAAQAEKTKDTLLAERLALLRELATPRREKLAPREQLERVLEQASLAEFDPQGARENPFTPDGLVSSPAQGRVSSTFAPEANPPRVGVGVSTPAGEKVRAVHSGRVAFAGEIKGLGRVAVVEHGRDTRSVYTGLASVDVKPGQDVAQGDVLGQAGEAPSGGPGMSFELRFGLKPINPSRWFPAS
ncbi:Murein DD-endopeptidase MepM [Fundidesulfovibrio magnetotacticus]|uniref:Murein DD-endopeptidase MepM n=1 Tax=Fundidesulfovibrio magnetotacticus TaxID=2730080 RepID=A0A6V8LKF6_9BACT|nr:M23 family metallopeptidase [Fundidesulfovibrio magnetotacticus]GFK93183.1 Murein DD-endopeptidase MepM [Fundidesulfovibrio magnetotacticus]